MSRAPLGDSSTCSVVLLDSQTLCVLYNLFATLYNGTVIFSKITHICYFRHTSSLANPVQLYTSDKHFRSNVVLKYMA